MKNLDKNSFEYRENILRSEWLWALDDFSYKEIGKVAREKIDVILDLNNFEDYFSKKFPDLGLKIEYDKWEIDVYDKKTKHIIWHIGSWKIFIDWYKWEEHLYFEVDNKYSWKWIWKFLYDSYVLLSKKYKNFIVPKVDYIDSPSMLNFYLKNEIYSIVSEYNFETKNFEELSLSEIENLKKENSDYFYDDYWNKRFFCLWN